MQEWTEADFDKLSWHDCHVHAWAIREGREDYGDGTLILDLDFILSWERPEQGGFEFQVAPATLQFFDISDLAITFDYSGFAVAPLSINGIERTLRVNKAGYRDYLYSLAIDYPPRGFIRFSGDRFKQTLRAEPIRTESQSLDHAQRPPFVVGA